MNLSFTKYQLASLAGVLFIFLLGWQNLFSYLQLDFQLIVCLLVAPFVFQLEDSESVHWRYGILSGLCLLVFGIVEMQIFYLLGLGFALFFWVESREGKLGILPTFLLLLLSPVMNYFVKAFTFPMRLKISELSGALLNGMGYAVEVQGNVFVVNDAPFSVDPACVGLNMVITGLVGTILLLAFAQKRYERKMPLIWKFMVMTLAFGLLMLANLFRVILLALFQSMPDTASHEIIGLICLLVYVLLPIGGLIHLLYKQFDFPHFQAARFAARSPIFALAPTVAFLVLSLVLGYYNYHREDYRHIAKDDALAKVEMAGFEGKILENGIAQFRSDSVLLYVKPPSPFWGSDHTPAICWQASGYEFARIRVEEVAGNEVFIGELQKGDDVLHTAWWYDNGEAITHKQWEWRWRTMQGEQAFRLINLTTNTPEELRRELDNMLTRKLPYQSLW